VIHTHTHTHTHTHAQLYVRKYIRMYTHTHTHTHTHMIPDRRRIRHGRTRDVLIYFLLVYFFLIPRKREWHSTHSTWAHQSCVTAHVGVGGWVGVGVVRERERERGRERKARIGDWGCAWALSIFFCLEIERWRMNNWVNGGGCAWAGLGWPKKWGKMKKKTPRRVESVILTEVADEEA
jgi:hypothetical protein